MRNENEECKHTWYDPTGTGSNIFCRHCAEPAPASLYPGYTPPGDSLLVVMQAKIDDLERKIDSLEEENLGLREDLSDAEQMLRMEIPDAEYSHANIPFWERITQFLRTRDENVFTGEADDDERLVSAALILGSLIIQNQDTLSAGVWNAFLTRSLAEAREEQEARETEGGAQDGSAFANAVNKAVAEDPANNWWLEEDAFEGWK